MTSAGGGPTDHRAIEKCAAAWLARRDSENWNSEDEVALTAWLNAATAHRVAFLRLESVWEGARRARALSSLPPGVVPPVGELRQSPFFKAAELVMANVASRRYVWRWRIAAACVVLVMALGSVAYTLDWFGPSNLYSTSVGTISSITLADGSLVTLNTASRIRVDFAPKERRVVLEKGEAYFVVRKDPNRPFIVLAGAQRIVDVGTQFSVRRGPNGLQVVVTEGTVRFEGPRNNARASGGNLPIQRMAEIDVPLPAGTVALAQDGDLLVHRESIREAEEMVTWREGYLTFHDSTLADVVAQFNRYTVHRITIEDPQVAGIRISGTFRPTNYKAFVRLLHDGYGINVRETHEGIVLRKE